MKRADILSAVAMIALAVVPAPVWASEAHGGEGKSSLPQLDVALYPGVLFWLVVIFTLFFLYIRFVGAPGVRKMRDKRAGMLASDLKAAQIASEEAKKVVESYEASLLEARQKANTMVSSILIQAEHEAYEHSDKLRDELDHRTRVAEENIAKARQKAMEDAPKHVNDLVQDLFAKVLQVDLSGARKAGAK